ncbi:MAG: hypothetical protein RL748_3217, partial [Pseudomonadota bacterium]
MTPIAFGVGVMVFCASVSAQTAPAAQVTAAAPLQVAQAAPAAPAAADNANAEPKKADRNVDPEVQKVVVKGLRASLQQSLNQKRSSDTMVEVITAEDIGKLPDKNVADAVQRLPGVNTSSSSSGEGGFDENDRVSIRGTSASLTQTLINGHAVGSGDWFILSQFGSVGRSVSFTLLPSELVGSVVVHKSASADLVEGGVSGAINIITRKPLEFKKQVTAEASLGGVYADKPKKTDPQFNALLNFKNDENTFGALVQVFSEKRSSRRDGQELLGYHAISPTSAAAVAHPELANVLVPNFIGSALFEQVRERTGGTVALQFKPSKDLTLGVDAFYSKLVATNSNINALANTGAIGDQIPTAYTIRNNTLVSATVPASAGYNAVITDAIYRPGEGAKSHFLNFDVRYRVNKEFTITGQAGSTKGEGFTPSQPAYESNANNVGLSYSLNGTNSPASVTLSRTAFSPANSSTGWAWDNKLFTHDKEKYAQVDGELVIDKGVLDTIKFGVRWADH